MHVVVEFRKRDFAGLDGLLKLCAVKMVEGLFMVETSRGCFDRAVGAGPIGDNEAFEVPFLLKNVGEQVFIFASKLAVDGVVGAHDRAWFGDFNADLERQQIRFPHGPPADDSAHLIPSAFLIVYGVMLYIPDDLLGLLDRLSIERVHLVGTAAGGSVALDFALSFPQRLRSLVIANAIGGVQDHDFLELGRRLRPPQFDALPPEFRELGPAYRAAQAEGAKRWMDLEKLSRPAGPPAPAQPLRNRLTFSALESINAPTLLITGGADLYAPPPLLRLFAARIKGSESLIVPEAGHSTYWEQPEIFNRAVLDFIGKH